MPDFKIHQKIDSKGKKVCWKLQLFWKNTSNMEISLFGGAHFTNSSMLKDWSNLMPDLVFRKNREEMYVRSQNFLTSIKLF